MNWVAVTVSLLLLAGLAIGVAQHGQPRRPHSTVESLPSVIVIFLLWQAGFFG